LARTVLLADDSVTAQNMGRRILMDAGYEVVTVNNGSAALKKIHESKPDLIVLDVYMPGYGGLEVCQRLKESGETMKIPILLSVGKMEPFKAEEAKRVRADGHIVKPFEASELLAALTRLEDRIVPQADPRGPRGKSPEKKTRFWHVEDPVANFADLPSENATYLAEVKKRQAEHHVAEPETSIESQAPAIAEVPTETPSVAANENPAVIETVPVSTEPEFSVQEADNPPQIAESSATSAEPALAELPVAEPVAEFPVTVDAQLAQEETIEDSGAEATSVQATIATQDLGEAVTNEVAAPTESAAVAMVVSEPPALAALAPGESGQRWVAENVALTAEEASLALDEEMRNTQAVAAHSVELEKSDAIPNFGGEEVSEPPSAEPNIEESGSGAALAAAASAAVSTLRSALDAPPLNVLARETAAEAEPPVPYEAAAAWENWRQIRDSVMSPQNASAIAESVAEIAKADTPVPTSEPSQQLLEGNAIASIVDSVLAELKPKLMQEIAKKMAAEKK